MKKRKVIDNEFNILNSENIKIGYHNRRYFFEIGDEITNDLGEAIAILLKEDKKSFIWRLPIQTILLDEIEPIKAIYWLTGGKEEWSKKFNYKKYWHECHIDFQEEFGWTIMEIIHQAKVFGDIREGFLKKLNLPILYNFALAKEII